MFIVALSVGLCAFCFSGPNDAKISQASAGSREVDRTRIWDLMPPDERAFITAVQDSAKAYRAGQADAKAARAKKLCEISELSHPLRGWVGRMAKLTKTSDGKGALSLSISQDIHVATGAGSSSEASEDILIQPNDPLFSRVSAFREGQFLRFFGEFVKSDADCVKEANSAVETSMTQPEFVFHFSDVFGL